MSAGPGGGRSAPADARTPLRPEPVRLGDLADPQFPAGARPILRAMADMGRDASLHPAELMEQAARATALDDFGAGDFVERLEVLCRALRDEARLSPVGRTTTSALLVGLLENRLRVEDLCRRHPEIERLELEPPVVICGLPRTGTTHLHTLLAADARFRSLPYWESLQPVPADEDRAKPGRPDPRLATTAAAVELLDLAMPHFRRMHEMTVDHVHEEIQLLAIDFSTMLFETTAPMPSWRDYYLGHDQTSSYHYLRKVLKALSWLRGPRRWVLKSPQHIEQFGPLRDAFPDATYVVTHRDPVRVTLSMATMVAYTARLACEPVDPVAIGRYWADRVERMLRSCVADRGLLAPTQSLDVGFADLMAHQEAELDRIYLAAGLHRSPASRRAMAAYARSHPRGRHGTVVYEPGPLGIDIDERSRALSFYAERFDTPGEPAS